MNASSSDSVMSKCFGRPDRINFPTKGLPSEGASDLLLWLKLSKLSSLDTTPTVTETSSTQFYYRTLATISKELKDVGHWNLHDCLHKCVALYKARVLPCMRVSRDRFKIPTHVVQLMVIDKFLTMEWTTIDFPLGSVHHIVFTELYGIRRVLRLQIGVSMYRQLAVYRLTSCS